MPSRTVTSGPLPPACAAPPGSPLNWKPWLIQPYSGGTTTVCCTAGLALSVAVRRNPDAAVHSGFALVTQSPLSRLTASGLDRSRNTTCRRGGGVFLVGGADRAPRPPAGGGSLNPPGPPPGAGPGL